MISDVPSGLLHVLTVGSEKELVLRVHGSAPTAEDLFAWMRDGAVQALTVSRHGDDETSTLVLNFRQVVGARVAPYSETRSAPLTGAPRPVRSAGTRNTRRNSQPCGRRTAPMAYPRPRAAWRQALTATSVNSNIS
jgi:hypothetical protein